MKISEINPRDLETELKECHARKRIMVEKLKTHYEIFDRYNIYSTTDLEECLEKATVENKELRNQVSLLSKFILSKGYNLDDFNQFIIEEVKLK